MNTGLANRYLWKGLMLVLVLSLSACVYGPYDTHARVGVHGYYDTAYDDFYFYPDVSVYLGINSGRYYYHPHDRWVGAWSLPRTIILRPERRVIIKQLPRGRPYDRYQDHHNRYGGHRDYDRDRDYSRDRYRDRDNRR